MSMSSLMDLQYDEAIVDRVRQLTPEFSERAAEVDRNSRFPIENFNDLRDAGLNAVCIPKEWNGAGANSLTYNLVLLELGTGLVDLTTTNFGLHILAEVTLILVLFSDAANIDLHQLRRHHNLLILVPGPTVILVTSVSMRRGFRLG